MVDLPFCEGISQSRVGNTPGLFRGLGPHMQQPLSGQPSGLARAHPTVALAAGVCNNPAQRLRKIEKDLTLRSPRDAG